MSIFRSQGSSYFEHLVPRLIHLSFGKHYEWRGIRQTRGLRSKAKRAMQQFSPHDFTAFKWAGSTDFLHYITVVLLLGIFLAAELNPFYLKVSLPYLAPKFTHNRSTELTVDGTGSSNHYRSVSWDLPMRPTCGQGTIPVYQ